MCDMGCEMTQLQYDTIMYVSDTIKVRNMLMLGLAFYGLGNTCVKVANNTFKVMKQHNYIIMMVTEVVTCVSYLQLNQHNTYFEKTKVVTHV